jgi:glycolate oxidase FAD binding subunit
MRILKPDTEEQVVEAIRDAQGSLAVEGRGTKERLGRAVAADTVLRLSGLTGITMYEPDEMVFTARAGTPLKEIEETLAAKNQCLAFEPGDWAPLWGRDPEATIGGTIAAAIAGPRRFASGGARDHLLGFVAVNGKGERFKAGGRVVKNVTGYDLPKLAAGSFGTLFAMTELTLRAVPRGATTAVLALEDKDPTGALRTLRAVAASPFEPSGLTHLTAKAAAHVSGDDRALTLVRLEGNGDGVAARAAELTRTLVAGARTLEAEEGARLFRAVADVHPLFDRTTMLWRASVPPTRANDLVASLNPLSWVADAAGGILWLEFSELSTADVHATAREHGGHATLVRRGAHETDHIFPLLDATTLALTRQLKRAFDPKQRLNPGRMYKDI